MLSTKIWSKKYTKLKNREKSAPNNLKHIMVFSIALRIRKIIWKVRLFKTPLERLLRSRIYQCRLEPLLDLNLTWVQSKLIWMQRMRRFRCLHQNLISISQPRDILQNSLILDKFSSNTWKRIKAKKESLPPNPEAVADLSRYQESKSLKTNLQEILPISLLWVLRVIILSFLSNS